MPPGRPETGQLNPQQAVRLPKAETTWRALLQDGDLMAESNDLSLRRVARWTQPSRSELGSEKDDVAAQAARRS